ncbi:MAG: FkbM family methyltransferase [Gammaproteobacteria bacterium]|nr:FkbM family methyltransferase [Gammaproteobacteria bacterium]MCP4832419.1 FkbM family methyltransferase [Gammaproteobacteria bacterium]
MNTGDLYLQTPSEIAKQLFAIFKPDDALTILDIGSCEGLDSIRYSNMFPDARVYAFEPLPANIEKIEANLKKYAKPNITIIKEALSDQQGTATFFVSSGHPDNKPAVDEWDYGNKSSSLLAPHETKNTHKWLEFNEEITVPTNTLENVCQQHGIDTIDFIHMDVQGAELMVLSGAGKLLSEIKLIWLEVEAIELYKDQPVKVDVEEFMRLNDFQLIKDTVGRTSGDQLYVEKAFYKKIKASMSLLSRINHFFFKK